MMESPATFFKSNFPPREDAPWLGTITSLGVQVLGSAGSIITWPGDIPTNLRTEVLLKKIGTINAVVHREESSQHTGIFPLPTGAYVITASVQVNPTTTSQIITIDANLPQRDIATGSIPQMTVTSSLNEFRLVTLGVQLAKELAHTLDQIKVFNRLAIYPIVSILEPYLEEANQYGLVLDMSPISSIGSKGTDVQGESFFRFLDELESGAYAADDITDEE